MRMIWIAATFLIALPLHAASFEGPLARAAEGQVHCYVPDTARKTCEAMSAYRLNPQGGIDYLGQVLLSNAPALTMSIVTPVVVREGEVCGPILLKDVEAATFTIEGVPATTEQTARLREPVRNGMARLIGRDLCTAYVPDGDGMMTRVKLDGVAHPEMDQKVIWVSPEEGYRVAPKPATR